jgi:release factor glutamine methyltransferase
MRLLDALKSSTEYLEKAGIEDAFADSEMLTLHAAGLDRLAAYMQNPEISKVVLAKIRRFVRRRAKGEPMQYIVGHIEFLGLKIYVGKGVLIPRPETELLAEEAIKTAQRAEGKGQSSKVINDQPFRVLDLCTGSGCIALALAKGFPDADVYAADVSKTALRYAKKNALENSVENVTFLFGSLFSPLKPGICFDLIVSNPPYVKRADIEGLQREIKEWEPVEALDGGVEGLDFYRRIFADARGHLCKGGKIIVELGFGQAMDVEAIALGLGCTNIEVGKDYAGIERILKAEL